MSVRFHEPNGFEFEVEVSEARADPEVGVVELSLELSPDQWDRVDTLGDFHLMPDDRGEGSISAGAAVRVDVRLDGDLADVLLRSDDVLAELERRSANGSDDPVLDTSRWHALAVTEALEIPEDMAGDGVELRSGFRTIAGGSASPAGHSTPEGVIRNVLAQHDIQAREADGTFEVDGAGAEGEWTLRIVVLDDDEGVLLLSMWPENVGESYRPSVMEAVTRLNVRTLSGAFILDPDTGELAFRSSCPMVSGWLDADSFAAALANNLTSMDDAFGVLDAVARQGAAPVAALAELDAD